MDPRIFGDHINEIADNISSSFHLSKCEAMGIVGQVMLNKFGEDRIKLSPEEVKVVENFVLASCLNDNEYIFRQ